MVRTHNAPSSLVCKVSYSASTDFGPESAIAELMTHYVGRAKEKSRKESEYGGRRVIERHTL